MSDYYLLITDAGKALEVTAHASGAPVSLTDFAVGDGGGSPVTPDATQTALTNETFRDVLSSLSVSVTDASVLEAECIIPASSGGYTIREIGIFASDGTLYAVGNFAEQEKPSPDSGYAASLKILADLVVSDTRDITLTVQDGSYLTETQADTIYLRQDKLLGEIGANGATAQSAARTNLGLGTAAIKDVTTSASDTTPGRLMKVGDGGLMGGTLSASNTNLTDKNGFPSMLFKQGGGSDSTHFNGSYGCGVHLQYGNGGDNTQALSANLFIDYAGNLTVEWLAVTISDGSILTQHTQKLYGPLNKPSAMDVGALPLTGGTLTSNGGILRLKNTTQEESNYILAQNADGTNRWYIGNGSIDNDDVVINNYATGAHIVLSADGTIIFAVGDYHQVCKPDGTFNPYSYANFDAKYQAKGSYYTTSQSDGRYVTKTQLGTRGSFSVGGNTTEAPTGCVLTGGGDFGSSDGSYFYRAMQYVINGAAHTAAYTATLQSAPSHHINILESLSVDSIDELINCQLYKNTYFTDDEFEDGVSVASLLDEQGFDFYQARSLLTGTVFIAYEPDTGIIRQIDTDPQLMWPIDMSMRGLNSLPDGCNINGTWVYVDGEVTQSPELVRARNKRILASKLSLVAGFGVMFQLLPDDVEPDEVQALKDYITALRSADLDSNQPAWPPVPAFIF
ncbi:phage tail protein [Scandinavium goeteborgense]|uniref:phage tail-collar fiber domain-containing protein n=1 Tax=Scandinavium goeteborgense TaxID=1851514 RepID=UPI0021658FC6|nr:phage tail protein [Scandinavium goeteborgense]MCS2152367.1 phage tail protein [Scandinavium goeteborgense]